MVIGFDDLAVGLLVLFLVGLRFQVCFFQFFSEKNLKNFGRGFSKMVIGFDDLAIGLLVLISCWFTLTGLLLPIFFRKKFKKILAEAF